LMSLICFEFMTIPYPMSLVDTPDFFKTLAQDKETYTIAALPMNWDRPAPLLYQTVHQKALLTAYTSRNNPLDLSKRTPILQQWRHLEGDIIKANLAEIGPSIFHDFNLRYIVLDYYQMPSGLEREKTEYWVKTALAEETPVYKNDRLIVYQTPTMSERHAYLRLGEGWGELGQVQNQPVRLLTAEAKIDLIGVNEAMHLDIIPLNPETIPRLNVSDGTNAMPIQALTEEGILRVTIPAGLKQVILTVSDEILVSGLHLGQ